MKLPYEKKGCENRRRPLQTKEISFSEKKILKIEENISVISLPRIVRYSSRTRLNIILALGWEHLRRKQYELINFARRHETFEPGVPILISLASE